MRLKVLKSKLHLATVTRSELYYHGSLTIDPDLMEAVGLVAVRGDPRQQRRNRHEGRDLRLARRPRSGAIELNGAMARLGAVGDRLIVMAFAELEADEVEGHSPRVVALDGRNRIVERIDYPPVSQACEPGVLSGNPTWPS